MPSTLNGYRSSWRRAVHDEWQVPRITKTWISVWILLLWIVVLSDACLCVVMGRTVGAKSGTGDLCLISFLSVSTYVDVGMKNKHRLGLTQKHVMKANMLFPCLALRINTSCYSGCVILGLA